MQKSSSSSSGRRPGSILAGPGSGVGNPGLWATLPSRQVASRKAAPSGSDLKAALRAAALAPGLRGPDAAPGAAGPLLKWGQNPNAHGEYVASTLAQLLSPELTVSELETAQKIATMITTAGAVERALPPGGAYGVRSPEWSQQHYVNRMIGDWTYLGSYSSPEQAARASDIVSIIIKAGQLNFPAANYIHILPLLRDVAATSVKLVMMKAAAIAGIINKNKESKAREGIWRSVSAASVAAAGDAAVLQALGGEALEGEVLDEALNAQLELEEERRVQLATKIADFSEGPATELQLPSDEAVGVYRDGNREVYIARVFSPQRDLGSTSKKALAAAWHDLAALANGSANLNFPVSTYTELLDLLALVPVNTVVAELQSYAKTKNREAQRAAAALTGGAVRKKKRARVEDEAAPADQTDASLVRKYQALPQEAEGEGELPAYPARRPVAVELSSAPPTRSASFSAPHTALNAPNGGFPAPPGPAAPVPAPRGPAAPFRAPRGPAVPSRAPRGPAAPVPALPGPPAGHGDAGHVRLIQMEVTNFMRGPLGQRVLPSHVRGRGGAPAKGVSKPAGKTHFEAKVYANTKSTQVGRYRTRDAAARAVDMGSIAARKPPGDLNFPTADYAGLAPLLRTQGLERVTKALRAYATAAIKEQTQITADVANGMAVEAAVMRAQNGVGTMTLLQRERGRQELKEAVDAFVRGPAGRTPLPDPSDVTRVEPVNSAGRFSAYATERRNKVQLGSWVSQIVAARISDIGAIAFKKSNLNYPAGDYAALLPLLQRLSLDDVVKALKSVCHNQEGHYQQLGVAAV